MMRSTLLLLSTLALCACGSVQPQLDWASDGDQMRDRALAFFLDATADDRIEATNGDNTDWKYIDIIDPGRLRVAARVDTPERLEAGSVGLYDKFGGLIERQLIKPNQTNYVFGTRVSKVPAKYFVQVFAKSGISVYSVGADLKRPPAPAAPQPVAVAPAPTPVAAPTRRRRTKRRRSRPVPKRAAPPPQPPAAAVTTVRGRVVRVIPTETPKRSVISIRLSSNAKVPVGARGHVVKSGERFPFKVTKSRGRKITASISVPPGKLTGNLTAVISFK